MQWWHQHHKKKRIITALRNMKERHKQKWLLSFVGWPPATWQTVSFCFLPHKYNSLIAVTLGLNKICIFLFWYLSYMRVCMFTSPPAPLKEGKTISRVQWNQNTELKGPEMLRKKGIIICGFISDMLKEYRQPLASLHKVISICFVSIFLSLPTF